MMKVKTAVWISCFVLFIRGVHSTGHDIVYRAYGQRMAEISRGKLNQGKPILPEEEFLEENGGSYGFYINENIHTRGYSNLISNLLLLKPCSYVCSNATCRSKCKVSHAEGNVTANCSHLCEEAIVEIYALPINTTSLLLVNTCLTKLPRNIFGNLTSLKTLRFNDNHLLQVLHEDTFIGLESLSYLGMKRLYNCKTGEVNHVTLKKTIFHPLKNLKHLILDQWLGFGEEHLKNIKDVVENLNNPKLETLSLNRVNGFSRQSIWWILKPKFFKAVPQMNLKKLQMCCNLIASIRSGVLNNLRNVEHLDLSENPIVGGDPNLFNFNLSYMENLIYLKLSGQNFIHFPKNAYPEVSKIEDINPFQMDENDADSACRVYFNIPPKLKIMDISNRNVNIPPSTHNDGVCVNSSNVLQYLDMSKNWLSKGIFGPVWNFPNLEELNVEGSRMLLENPAQFNKLTNLRRLNLSSCSLDWIIGRNNSIWERILSNITLGNLTKLDLSRNDLSYLPPNVFSRFHVLSHVNLNNNKLTEVMFNILGTNMTHLDLSHNRISHLSDRVVDDWKNQSKEQTFSVNLAENQFTCSCVDIDFIRWAQSETRIRFDGFNCTSNQYGNIEVLKIPLDNFKETCDPVAVAAFVVFFVFLFGVSFITMSIRYRWHILVIWYREKKRTKKFHRKHAGLLYDAFICYNSGNLDWVANTLVPALEDKYGYKLCVHDRDFHVGLPIVDNIMEAFDRSRKVLLVISRNCIGKKYFNFELRLAQVENIEKVICILLEDPGTLPRERMPGSLQFLLSTNTYIIWKKRQAVLFWMRLRDSLGKPIGNTRDLKIENEPESVDYNTSQSGIA